MNRRPVDTKTLLAALALFKAQDSATLDRLAAAALRRPLVRGERLFRRGDPATGMYVVVFGSIKLVAAGGSRRGRLTGIVGPGRSFGEPVMFLERPAVVDAVAVTDALVLQLPKEAVFAELERNPRFARLMIANLSERAEALVHELNRHALGGGRDRFIDYLVRHAGRGPGPQTVTLSATKAAIASSLNLTPEHFSRVLHKLEADGLLSVDGRHIVVPDMQRLTNAGRDGRAR
jgi:cAMP-binding proteins - catabolite gene activator and regulatory subunit of cAMP-dependent protein kinases